MKLNYKTVFHYILLYVLLMYHGSIVFKKYQDIVYVAVLVLFFIRYIIKGQDLYKRYVIAIIGLLASLFLTFILTSGDLGIPSILNIFCSFAFSYIVYDYDKKMVLTRYVKIVTFFSIVSLICFGIQCININVLKNFLGTIEQSNQIFYGGIFYTVTGSNRNVGMFAEPGLYQIVLSVSLFLILFEDEKLFISEKWKKIILVITIITLITAQSTTGYLSLVVLLAVFILQRNKSNSRVYVKLLIIGVALFLTWDISKGNDGLIYQTVISKMFDQTGNIDVTVSTGSSRYYSMLADLSVAVKHPFGVGYKNYAIYWRQELLQNIGDATSCVGFTYSCAAIGFISTFYIIFMYLILIKRNFTNVYMMMAYILLFINITMAQPSIRYPAMMLVLFVENSVFEEETNDESLVVDKYQTSNGIRLL